MEKFSAHIRLGSGESAPLVARRRLEAAWVVYSEGSGRARRCLRDLHWAKDPLLGLLGRSDDVPGRLLVIGTYARLLERSQAGRNARRQRQSGSSLYPEGDGADR
jgi:hypothetical protein